MLKGMSVSIRAIKKGMYALFAAVLLMSGACDRTAKEEGVTTMAELTPRSKALFEKTKIICFGRFLIDVPESTEVLWGGSMLPLDVNI